MSLRCQRPRNSLTSFTATLWEVGVISSLLFYLPPHLSKQDLLPIPPSFPGDLASAIAITVLEENDRNYGGAVKELEVTLKALEDVIESEEEKSQASEDVDFEVIDALLDAIEL